MRHNHFSIIAAAFAAALVLVAPAGAEPPQRAGRWGLEGGVGFTADPEFALLTTSAVYGVRESLLLVPTVQWAFKDGDTIIAPSMSLRYLFTRDNFVPFAELGIGFAYSDQGSSDDTEFMLNPGFGVDYALSNNVSLVSAMRFNILPADSDWFYSWEVIGAQYRF